jgi:lipoprotein-anchoring transpeptidase ErfK/SrfK
VAVSLPRKLLALLAAVLVAPVAPFAGTVAVAQDAPAPERTAQAPEGDASPNSVSAYGAAPHLGPAGSMDLVEPLAAMAARRDGSGYWLLGGDGGVFTFGDASFHGSTGGMPLNDPVVAMAATAEGDGYWLAAADGGVFAFGDAKFQGSAGSIGLNEPVVGIAATPSGDGYWLVASDGGIFSYGDATFHGSAGDIDLDRPIVGMAATATGDGYWLVAEDGGVFTFGDAEFDGSAAGEAIDGSAVAIAAASDGAGYWVATSGGTVFAFGLEDHGSATEIRENPAAVVGMAAHRSGYWLVHGRPSVLQPDDEGAQVAALQARLRDLGYWVGPVDGVFGELTKQALYAFQKYEGLRVDGLYGPETRSALATASRPAARGATGSRVEVDESRQLLFVVRDGETLWVFNTATGNEEPYRSNGQTFDAETPNGQFTIFRQIDGWRTSHLGRLYRPKYFTTTGIAIHGYSFVPPHPASHGCVRVSIPAMDYIWANDLMPINTGVWVYGSIPT